MGQFDTNVRNFWNYYLELESEFVETKRFVEFHKDNYNSFSVEFLKLFQAICSEIDVLGKHIASLINPSFSRSDNKSIQQWWIEIQDYADFYSDLNKWHNPLEKPINLSDAQIYNYLLNESFQPWKKYNLERYLDKNNNSRIRLKPNCQTPTWWTAYNAVKHHRTELNKNGELNFKKASLKNVCESISALYILEILVLELSIKNKAQYESFYNESKLFNKVSLATSEDIDELFR